MQIIGHMPLHITRAYGVMKAAPAHRAANAAVPQKLVAGKVARPVDFTAAESRTSPASDALQLYTRAADRVEAAVAIQVGRRLDVTG
jgi:hypothetical protein